MSLPLSETSSSKAPLDRRAKRRKGLPSEVADDLTSLYSELRSLADPLIVRQIQRAELANQAELENHEQRSDAASGEHAKRSPKPVPVVSATQASKKAFSSLAAASADDIVDPVEAPEVVITLGDGEQLDTVATSSRATKLAATALAATATTSSAPAEAIPAGWSVGAPYELPSRFEMLRRAARARLQALSRSLRPSEWRSQRQHRRDNRRYSDQLY